MSSKIVDIVGHKPGVNQPVILENFETYLEPRQHDMKWLLARDTTNYKPDEGIGNVLVVSGEKKLYVGPISTEPYERDALAPPASQLRTFVARHNKVTGKVRLCEVRSCTLKHISQDRPSDGAPVTELDVRQLERLQAKLNPRMHRQKAREQRQQIDMAVMQEKLEQALANTVVKESTVTDETGDSVNDVLQRELQGKANPTATTLADLYQAERLIGADEWVKLIEPARQLLQVPPEELHMVNTYLENKVKAAMQSSEPASDANLSTLRICLYMDVLARLAGRMGYKLAKFRESVSPFTDVLNGPVKGAFMESVQGKSTMNYQVTKYTRIKALMYYIALAFAMEQQQAISVQTLHRSLEVPRDQLLSVARSVGARFHSSDDTLTLGKWQTKQELEHTGILKAVLKDSRMGGRY